MNPTDRARHELNMQYDDKINRVFALMKLSDKQWDSEDDYLGIYEQLKEAQKEARRIDELRYKVTK